MTRPRPQAKLTMKRFNLKSVGQPEKSFEIVIRGHRVMYGKRLFKEGEKNNQKEMLTKTEKWQMYDKIKATFSSVFSSLLSPFYKLNKLKKNLVVSEN